MNAGQTNQGANAVAIGNLAGQTNQTAGSIAINATGVAVNPAAAGLFVAPIRNVDVTNVVGYNTGTSEVTYFDETNLFGVGTPILFVPTLTDSGGGSLNAGNYLVRTGSYIKVGRMVFYQAVIYIQTSTASINAANTIQISLPFLSLNQAGLAQTLSVGRILLTTPNMVSFGAVIQPNTTFAEIWFRTAASGLETLMVGGNLTANSYFSIGGSYIANS